jgi:hypothetical protein
VISNEKSPEYDEVPPNAAAMAEAMRAYGYSLSSAISDLIDNSITARATKIDIRFEWQGRESRAVIADNGCGMSEAQLRDAMRLGSTNPLELRAPGDLGRFGLGLKTASFSQCRRLTVYTQQGSSVGAIRRWDLDHLAKPGISGWQLLHRPAPGSDQYLALPKEWKSGTIVLWEILDRAVGSAAAGDQSARKRFYANLALLEDHLAMTYHRYLSTPRHRLEIKLNGNLVAGWDPFAREHRSTRVFPEESITIEGIPGTMVVTGYVLPHKDRLGADAHQGLSGPRGWNAQQGFYLYRNERLILPGNWLGLGSTTPWTKEEHYKLARLMVDIPNSMDQHWQLDVKKSSAIPPEQIRDRLRDLAARVRKDARTVFAHRGKYGVRPAQTGEISRVWQAELKGGLRRYRIDRGHPVLGQLLRSIEGDAAARIESMFKLIEESVPVEQVWLDKSDKGEEVASVWQSMPEAKVREHLIAVIRQLMEVGNGLHESASIVRSCDEYNGERELAILASVLEEWQ